MTGGSSETERDERTTETEPTTDTAMHQASPGANGKDHDGIAGDIAAAVDFLNRFVPEGPWVLTAIDPETRQIETRTFTTDAPAAPAIWIERWLGVRNIYFQVNRPKRALSTKAKKADVQSSEWLHVDADPRPGYDIATERARILADLRAHDPPPSVIVDTGGGYGGYWRLTEKADVRGDPTPIEARNLRIAQTLGGDHCHNIDRIMRLPGTINLPDAAKQARGRVPALARVVEADWERRYALGTFPAAAMDDGPRSDASPMGGNGTDSGNFDALPDDLRELIATGDASRWNGDRSRAVWFVCCALVRAGWSDADIAAVIADPANGISAHVLDQGKPAAYALRQARNARQEVRLPPVVAELNRTYAVVIVGGKVGVLKEGTTPDGRPDFTIMSPGSLAHWLANRTVKIENRSVPVDKIWMRHPGRRQYESITFAPNREAPGCYNLWRGFSVRPVPGDCAKFLAHVRENICQSNDDHFRWVMGWFADIVQHPDAKCGTSLALIGEEGTGKTVIGEHVGSLLIDHYLLVSDPRYITGRFNSHVVSCLLLHADEAVFAGDHAAASKLKDMITGNYHMVEFKGYEPLRVKNYVRLLFTGNPPWVVPVSMEGRRFAVFELSKAHRQDHAYFAAIAKEMDSGGREALLHYLLHYDLSGIDLRSVPKTEALLGQKLASLTPEQAWWMDVLQSGGLPSGCGEAGATPAKFLFNHYIRHAQKIGARRRSIETIIGTRLREFAPGVRKVERTYTLRGGMMEESGPVYQFPPLAECRAAFAELLHQEVTWGEPEEWVEDPVETGEGDF